MASYDEVMTALRNADAAGDTEAATRLAQIASGLKQTPNVSGSVDKIGSVVNTVSEPITALATGTAGAVAGGLAGIAGAVLPGPEGQGADWSQKVQNALTYKPQSAGGKAVLGAINAPFEWLGGKARQAGEATLGATGSPAAATVVDTAIQSAPMFAGRIAKAAGMGQGEAPASVAARAAEQSRNSVKDTTLANARAEGYVVPPSAIKGSFLGNRVEGIGGKAAIGQEAAVRNQSVTNAIARREAGLAEDSPISEGTLSAAREAIAQPYREVSALSPRAAQAFERLQQTRADAKDWWQSYNRSAHPTDKKQAQVFDDKAKMLETFIDKEAGRVGNTDLVDRVRDAREKLAKNYDVERALNLGSGDVDAAVLGRMLDNGKKLSGGLETIAKFQQSFRPYAKDASTIPTPGVSKVEGLAAAHLGLAGHNGGLGWLPGGLPLASGPARSFMLSQMMQKPRTYEPGMFTNMATSPNLPPALGSLGLAGMLNNKEP